MMSLHEIPLIFQFIGTLTIVFISIQIGYKTGIYFQKKYPIEKEQLVSMITSSVLGLLAFLLAFTFNNVSSRFDKRKQLVREEANQIYTTYLRTEFLPEGSREESRALLKEYVKLRTGLIDKAEDREVEKMIVYSQKLQDDLWKIACRHANNEMKIGIGSLYFDSLNRMFDLQGLRVSVGYQEHVPSGVWATLFFLLVMAMFTLGYHSAILSSYRFVAVILIAFSFAIVIAVVSSLDDLNTSFFRVPQQALIDVRERLLTK